jgi:hypothetical protein
MSDWSIVFDITAKLDWMKPPVDLAEEFIRRQQDYRIHALAKKLEPEFRQMLLDAIEDERAKIS